jgi:hypothetical protein
VADLDGDGHLDILAAITAGNYPDCCFPSGDTISFLRGNGNGSFRAAIPYHVGISPFSIAVADLDGDGNPDVATANWHSNDVTVLLHGPKK